MKDTLSLSTSMGFEETMKTKTLFHTTVNNSIVETPAAAPIPARSRRKKKAKLDAEPIIIRIDGGSVSSEAQVVEEN